MPPKRTEIALPTVLYVRCLAVLRDLNPTRSDAPARSLALPYALAVHEHDVCRRFGHLLLCARFRTPNRASWLRIHPARPRCTTSIRHMSSPSPAQIEFCSSWHASHAAR